MMSLATALIAQRLLGPAEWLADCEAKHALRSALVPRSAHINIDLLCTFAGLLRAGEVVMMLEDYGLIEEKMADERAARVLMRGARRIVKAS